MNFKITFFSYSARLLITLISKTLFWRSYNTEYVESIKESGKNVIFSFWHGRQFLLVYSHRNRGAYIMTSLSKDGDLQTKILRGFGFKIVRGSSTRGGFGAAREMLKKIKKGSDVAFAVDGPRGPAYDAKLGVIFLAAMTNRVIIPVAASASRVKIFKSTWDKYRLPIPFSKVAYMYGKPIEVSRQDDFEQKRQQLNKAIQKVTEELDNKMK